MISRHQYLGPKDNTGKTRICVYDSLRDKEDMKNILKFCDTVGTFQSLPIYNLFEVKDEDEPVLLENGITSVKFTVFELFSHKVLELENHYRFITDNNPNNIYNKTKIETPWGEAYVYTNNLKLDFVKVIDSGDWLDYKNYKDASNDKYIDLKKENIKI